MAIFKRKTEAPKAKEPAKALSQPKKSETKSTKAEKPAARNLSALATRTIVAPLATEKAAHLADKGVYAFVVSQNATRVAVKQAIHEMYRVLPVKVNIINVRGKMKRFGRSQGRQSDMRKALVTLPKGSHIDVFESV